MESRRDFLKKGAYIAPLVLTLGVRPSYAKGRYGHGGKGGNGGHGGKNDSDDDGGGKKHGFFGKMKRNGGHKGRNDRDD